MLTGESAAVKGMSSISNLRSHDLPGLAGAVDVVLVECCRRLCVPSGLCFVGCTLT